MDLTCQAPAFLEGGLRRVDLTQAEQLDVRRSQRPDVGPPFGRHPKQEGDVEADAEEVRRRDERGVGPGVDAGVELAEGRENQPRHEPRVRRPASCAPEPIAEQGGDEERDGQDQLHEQEHGVVGRGERRSGIGGDARQRIRVDELGEAGLEDEADSHEREERERRKHEAEPPRREPASEASRASEAGRDQERRCDRAGDDPANDRQLPRRGER